MYSHVQKFNGFKSGDETSYFDELMKHVENEEYDLIQLETTNINGSRINLDTQYVAKYKKSIYKQSVKCVLCDNTHKLNGGCVYNILNNQAATCNMSKDNNQVKATTSKKKKTVNGIFCINQVSCTSRRKFLTVDINGSQATLQLDTASDITIISQKVWRKNLGSPSLKTTTRTAKTASGNQLHLLGELQCSVTVGGVTKTATFYVTKNGINLFGLDWIELFELWDSPLSSICNQVQATSDHINQVDRYKAAYPEVFKSGLGHCKKMKAAMTSPSGSKIHTLSLLVRTLPLDCL
nr:uncharacterized protein K02A2.6-like [Aedes albopictus]